MADITQILCQIESGDPAAALVHDACIRPVNVVRLHGTIADQIVSTRHATGVWDWHITMLLNHGPLPEESFSRARVRPFSNSALEAPLDSQGQRLSVRLPQATAGVTLPIAL